MLKNKTAYLFSKLFFAIIILAVPVVGRAVQIENPLGETTTIAGLVDNIATFLIQIGIPITTIMILVAAIQFMFAGGSEKRVTTARQTLTYAVIGLGVLLLAKGVSSVITSFLGG